MVKSAVLWHAQSWVQALPMLADMFCKYVCHKDSAAMLTSKSPAGVTPEVNLRNALYASDKKNGNEGSTLALKPRVDFARSSKQGYQ